jgi:C_GCAxxG_C_C family probable redox protein
MSLWRNYTMSNSDLAAACFEEGFNCSQSVLAPFAPALGLDRDTGLRVAAAFGGGMGRTGESCGAVSGALMAIGLRYAQPSADEKDAKERTYELAAEFLDRFAERNNGCVKCRELLGRDISTPEGLQAAREQDLFKKLCPKFVRDAAEIVEQMI